jgi:formylglycine-generating enzyme required for sulfatase activity
MRLAPLAVAVALLSGCGGKALYKGGVDAAAGAPGDTAPPPSAVDSTVAIDATVAVDGTAIVVDAPRAPEPVPDARLDATDPTDARPAVDLGPPRVLCPTCASAQSCQGAGVGLSMCGAGESCCSALAVPGGEFFRSYSGAGCPGGAGDSEAPVPGCYDDKTAPAKVSPFLLDKFEVTVARFRRFMTAVVAGWRPPAGSGVHTHLRGGWGVEDVQARGSYERGWDPAWNVDLFSTQSEWDRYIATASSSTATPEHSEDRPIGGVSWAQAYAFCIWDGGFLPTEAEWNFAAAGGEDQRVFPWSDPPHVPVVDCDHARYGDCLALGDLVPVGGTSPKGDGRWGHAELAGNRAEWTLDWFGKYLSPCEDCARLREPPEDELPFTPARANRGLYGGSEESLRTMFRAAEVPIQAFSSEIGIRCARPLTEPAGPTPP